MIEKLQLVIFPLQQAFSVFGILFSVEVKSYINIIRLTGDAGGGRGERLIIFLSFKSITIPIYEKRHAQINLTRFKVSDLNRSQTAHDSPR